MKLRQFLLACSLCAMLCERAVAANWPLEVPKGATVVLKVPLQFWKAEDPSFSTGAPIFSIDATIRDKQDWESAGLPYFGEFVVTKIFEFRPFYKLKYTDIELRNSSTWGKLRFQPDSDIPRGFRALTFTGKWSEFEKSDYFKNVVFGTVAARIFTGSLARIPDQTKLALLRIAGTGFATVIPETYKDKTYIGFTFPVSGTVYNSIKLNESARVATAINSRLALIKSLAILADGAGVDGVKIKEDILYRNFVSETVAKTDTLQYYAPLTAIRQFSSADITSQQFVDQCVVILNDNRIQVLLSSGS